VNDTFNCNYIRQTGGESVKEKEREEIPAQKDKGKEEIA
jgi:hypothetical protein